MSSVGTYNITFNDTSGLITVSVFSHISSPPKEHWIDEEILVGDGDMLAIGGGGQTTDRSPYKALLTASYPNNDLSGWVVSSKDHEYPHPHELITHVIGIKIKGMSRQQLLESMYVSTAASGVASHPEAETGVPSDNFVLVGGGFRVDWHGAGNLGTASFPITEFSWKACSKDHGISDPSNLQVFAICIKKNISVGTVTVAITKADSNQTPHPEAVALVKPGFALVGGGAEVHWNELGNFLWKLEPSTSQVQSFSAASKDVIYSDPSIITAYALGIRIDE